MTIEQQLPLFEGSRPQGATLQLTGKADQYIGALARHDKVFLIVKGHVDSITHKDGKVGGADLFIRQHGVKASQIVLLDPSDGERMLDEARLLAEEKFGIDQMFRDAERAVDTSTGEISDGDDDGAPEGW